MLLIYFALKKSVMFFWTAYCYRTNNETIDYILTDVTTNRKSCWIRTVIIWVSVIKRLSLHEFSLWGRDFMTVVRIIEGPYYRGYFLQRMYGHFPGTKWTFRIREVSVRRGSTVMVLLSLVNIKTRLNRLTYNWHMFCFSSVYAWIK